MIFTSTDRHIVIQNERNRYTAHLLKNTTDLRYIQEFWGKIAAVLRRFAHPLEEKRPQKSVRHLTVFYLLVLNNNDSLVSK